VTDPAERIRAVRATIAAEGLKTPAVDANGHGPGNGGLAELAASLDPPPPAAPESQPTQPPGPKPDPSQGARGGGPPVSTYATQLEAAKSEGRTLDYLSLLNHPINASRELGISVEQWHQQYGSRPVPPTALTP
jgi:hypothetical protein